MQNNFQRHKNFIKEISIIKLKSIKEYKINLYFMFLANFGYVITIFFTYFILKKNFNEIFYWTLYEFTFFFLFIETALFLFVPWFRRLWQYLLSGEINQFLIKPINPFIHYAFHSNKYFEMVLTIFYIFYILVYFIFTPIEFQLFKFLIVVICSTFGGIMYASINCLFDSLGFFMKNNNQLKRTYYTMSNIASQYPASFFKNSNIFYLMLFFANTYTGIWITDYYFNYISFNEILILYIPCILLIATCLISSYFLWKFGLKKYEGYN